MSHLHIPDGVLPFWLWFSGLAITGVLLALALWRLRGMDLTRRIPLLGVTAAMMVVSMSLEIVPIAYHVNLSIVAGALLGPALGFVCAFLVEVILALLGHGGVTVVGLNTMTVGGEVVLGSLLFKGSLRLLRRERLRPAVAGATILTLLISTSLALGIVGVSGINPRAALETGVLNPETLRLENPFAPHPPPSEPGNLPGQRLALARLAAILYVLAIPGWLLEAMVTSLMVGFVAKVRPDLLGLGPPHVPYGEEAFGDGRH